MISIILTILKIIGIILLCILGFVIFMVLCVLFVPIRYSFYANYDKKINAKARLSWFLHIISFSFVYKGEEPIVNLKIFGIPLTFFKNIKNKASSSKQKHTVSQDKQQEESNIDTDTTNVITDIPSSKENESIETSRLSMPAVVPQENEKKGHAKPKHKKKSILLKIKDCILKIKKKFLQFLNKLKNIRENISYYIELLSNDNTKAAFATCKHRFKKLFHHVIPKKFQIHISYGLEDPATTAKILAVHSIFYAYIGNYIFLHPDFEEQKLCINAKGNGRITSGILGYHILRVFFDKNCRNFISRLKKESSNE